MVAAAQNPYRTIVAGRRPPTAAPQRRNPPTAPSSSQSSGPREEPGADRVLREARARAQKLQAPRIQRHASHADERNYDENGDFNPQAFGGTGWKNGRNRALPDPARRIFDKRGHIEADNSRDALQQIAYLLQNSVREAKTAQFRQRSASVVEAEERRQILAAAAEDPEGFRILGQELLLPIKDIIDYESWGRKVLRVRPLAQGEFFRITKDVRSTAWVIGQDGQGVESRLHVRMVTPDLFKIVSYPTVDIADIYTANYDILDRAQDTARQEIELEEDKRIRALVDHAAQTANRVTTFATLNVGAFEDIRLQVEQHRLIVEKFLIHRQELSDIVKTMSSSVDPVTERELILAGYIGSFLNAMIITAAGTGVEEVVPAGTVYAVTGSDYLGELGVQLELFSEPFNLFALQKLVKGWAFAEMVGGIIPNARSCAKGTK